MPDRPLAAQVKLQPRAQPLHDRGPGLAGRVQNLLEVQRVGGAGLVHRAHKLLERRGVARVYDSLRFEQRHEVVVKPSVLLVGGLRCFHFLLGRQRGQSLPAVLNLLLDPDERRGGEEVRVRLDGQQLDALPAFPVPRRCCGPRGKARLPEPPPQARTLSVLVVVVNFGLLLLLPRDEEGDLVELFPALGLAPEESKGLRSCGQKRFSLNVPHLVPRYHH